MKTFLHFRRRISSLVAEHAAPLGATFLMASLIVAFVLMLISCSSTRRIEAKAYDSTITVEYVNYRLVRGREGDGYCVLQRAW